MKLKIRGVKLSSSFLLILTLAIIAGMLFAWKIFISPRRSPQLPATPTPTAKSKFTSPSPSPSLSLIPTPAEKGKGDSPEELTKSLKEKFPLIESVPYETENFSLDYRAPLRLEVKIKKVAEASKIKEEVSDWLWSKGVNPSTHQIDWVTP